MNDFACGAHTSSFRPRYKKQDSSIMAAPCPCRPLRSTDELHALATVCQDPPSMSLEDQQATETTVLALFSNFAASLNGDTSRPRLQREETLAYLNRGLGHLPGAFHCLDASRPWLVYWILHSMELLGQKPEETTRNAVRDFLKRCQNPGGGFGGGPGQLSHLAPTYAAVNALAILSDPKSLAVIDRASLSTWLNNMRKSDGSFMMHEDGEVCIRGAYCAISIARLTNIFSRQLFEKTDEWLLRCQSFDGGFGSEPGNEAHGGYSFCGVASLVMLGKQKLCNTDRLLRWAVNRQMKLEGGFQGRPNKLVDGCYSFWQGGIFPILHEVMEQDGHAASLSKERWMFDQESLQEYLLICCQDPRGGLLDKPGRVRDYYHTCYALSGLSVAQNFDWVARGRLNSRVLGPRQNLLAETHPLYNVGVAAARAAANYFSKFPIQKS